MLHSVGIFVGGLEGLLQDGKSVGPSNTEGVDDGTAQFNINHSGMIKTSRIVAINLAPVVSVVSDFECLCTRRHLCRLYSKKHSDFKILLWRIYYV